jgi:hypothetical protein
MRTLGFKSLFVRPGRCFRLTTELLFRGETMRPYPRKCAARRSALQENFRPDIDA